MHCYNKLQTLLNDSGTKTFSFSDFILFVCQRLNMKCGKNVEGWRNVSKVDKFWKKKYKNFWKSLEKKTDNGCLSLSVSASTMKLKFGIFISSKPKSNVRSKTIRALIVASLLDQFHIYYPGWKRFTLE